MRWMIAILSLSVMLGYTAQAAWAEGEVAKREDNQQDRIAQGAESGQLTAGETARLEHGEQKIEKAREKALSDGKMTKREKAKLNRMENKESRRIRRAKHNRKKA